MSAFQPSRRTILRSTAAGFLASLLPTPPRLGAAEIPGLIRSIDRSVIRDGRHGGTTWFHPRACVVPGEPHTVLMTLQSISGSDVFGPVHWSQTQDLGKTWTDPQPIPGMGRRKTQ